MHIFFAAVCEVIYPSRKLFYIIQVKRLTSYRQEISFLNERSEAKEILLCQH